MTRYGFLSTYPPTRCGLATFTSALASAIAGDSDDEAVVIRVDDLVPAGESTASVNVRVIGDLRPGSRRSRAQAVAKLNTCDVVIVQHEYGIYGGRDGDEVIDILERLRPPCIVVLHTVLENPTRHQGEILQRIAQLVDATVVMTQTAKTILVGEYGISSHVISVIPHGVDARLPSMSVRQPERPVVLSWGLIGPGKGIEWGIRAFSQLTDLVPRPIYRVLGQTHPKVVLNQGEKYRHALQELAVRLGVANDIHIDGGYRESEELTTEIAAASIVLLPYDSREQSTSGVLVEAVAAGKLVIATRFPHAIELLSGGTGVLVDQQQPDEIADAIRCSLTNRSFALKTAGRAREASTGTSWASVAALYKKLIMTHAASLRAVASVAS